MAIIGLSIYASVSDDHKFYAHYEQTPADPSLVLDCPGNNRAYWAAGINGSAAGKCVFSGDTSLPTGVAMQEGEVAELCADRHDCAGYIRRQNISYLACNGVCPAIEGRNE